MFYKCSAVVVPNSWLERKQKRKGKGKGTGKRNEESKENGKSKADKGNIERKRKQ